MLDNNVIQRKTTLVVCQDIVKAHVICGMFPSCVWKNIRSITLLLYEEVLVKLSEN